MALLLGLLGFISFCLFIRVSFITISYYWLNPRRIKRFMEKQGVRGPKPHFLRGNSRDISSFVSSATSNDMGFINHDIVGRILPHYLFWSKQYGKRFIYWVGIEPRMCLTDREMIKEFYSAKCNNISGKSWLQREGSKHFIGGGLLMANGDDWHHQRRIVSRAFMTDKLKTHVRYMVECTEEMLQSLYASVESGKREVEISEYMARVTADIISRTEFDSSYAKGQQMFHLLTKLQHLSSKSNQHLFLPGSRFFPSKYIREIKSLKMKVEKILKEIIQTRQDSITIDQSITYGNDLLSMLLVEMEKRERSSFTLQLLMDECKTFFFAGHETTALHLTWTVMLLAANPSWQNKVRTEVFEVCKGETPSVDQLSKFTLLNMIIYESLRLYPPVFLFPRMVFEDIKLGDLHIPKGLAIWVPELGINHSEELWGKDVNEFNPERFAKNSFTSERQFMPFGMGPRNCIGQAFAMMEAKIILAMLISRFSFTISNNYRHAPISIITLKPKYGVQINLKPLSP